MSNKLHTEFSAFAKMLYPKKAFIGLHEPVFIGREKELVNECIESTFVSSVGKFVDQFEKDVAKFTGHKYAIATCNGTTALHLALHVLNLDQNSEVITQALTFVATANAISMTGAVPVFIDVDPDTMGMSPRSLEQFLSENSARNSAGELINKHTKRRIRACVPMHTFGHPVRIAELAKICNQYGLALIEDAAEALGSYINNQHVGHDGQMSVLSFNGNKSITTGGGGIVLTNDEVLAKRCKHLSTTAKRPHAWLFEHDEVAFNYRLPNINAALGVAQLEQLPRIMKSKLSVAAKYREFFRAFEEVKFVDEPKGCKSNFWLNAILLPNLIERDRFLEYTNANGVMTRPTWTLITDLKPYVNSTKTELPNSKEISERLVNIPSGYTEAVL